MTNDPSGTKYAQFHSNHLPIHANLLPQHQMIINYIHKGHHVRIFEKKRKKLWQQHLVTVVSVAK
jgi:hypothetical protein